jgi:uncharacterized protein YoxC
MWSKIVDLAITNGLWAVMFLGLLIYLLKDSRTREVKYQETIKELNKTLNVVNEIREDITEIKQEIISNSKKAG